MDSITSELIEEARDYQELAAIDWKVMWRERLTWDAPDSYMRRRQVEVAHKYWQGRACLLMLLNADAEPHLRC